MLSNEVENNTKTTAKNSIKNTLLIIQLVILLPLLAIFITNSIVEADKIFAERIKVQLAETEKIANSENLIDAVRHTLVTLAASPSVKNFDKKNVLSQFKDVIKETGLFHNLLLANRNGEVLLSAVEVNKPLSASDRLYFKRALKEKDFVWGEFAISRSTGKPVIHFAMPVLNEKKEVAFVIIAVPVMEKVLPFLGKTVEKYEFVDENGKIVFTNDTNQIGKTFPHIEEIKRITKNNDIFPHENHFVVFSKMVVNDKVFGYVTAEVNFSKLDILMQSKFIYELCFLLLIIALCVYWTRRIAKKHILKPLSEIKNSFERFEQEQELIKIKANYTGELETFKNVYNKFIEILSKTTEEIENEKDLWLDTFNSFPDPVFIVDKDFRIIRANESFYQTFNITKDRLKNIRCYEVVDKTDKPVEYCPHKDVLDKNISYSYELFFDELNKWYFITYSPLKQKGVTTATIHIFKDVTKIKIEEQERLKIEKQLLHTQRLESLGILAGGIAHDFNNMLTGILGNAELALMETDQLPSRVTKCLETIKLITDKAAHLTRQMLAYAGKGKFTLKEIELNDFIKDICDLIKVSISKKAVLNLNLSKSEPLVIQGDPAQIEQVILNLVINASEALEDREGLISISTGKQWCDKKYFESTVEGELTNLPEGEYAYFEVIDTGCGMDKETMGKIFEPFFTTKFTGRGLGLSAILGIVKGHGGAIKVYSEKGKGTSFKIIFPIHKAAINNDNKAKTHANLTNKTLLIIDDEEMVRDVAKKLVEILGGNGITANDGKEGVEIFKENINNIDIVLLDLTMPKLSGEEVFREIKKLKNDVKVVLMSGYNEQDISQRLVGRGFAGFIQKPFSIEKLTEVLQQK